MTSTIQQGILTDFIYLQDEKTGRKFWSNEYEQNSNGDIVSVYDFFRKKWISKFRTIENTQEPFLAPKSKKWDIWNEKTGASN